MDKKEIISKMTILGFIRFIVVTIMAILLTICVGIILLIPFVNVSVMSSLIDRRLYKDYWEEFKTDYKVIKQTKLKVVEEILERVR